MKAMPRKLNYKKIAKRSFFYAWTLVSVLSLLELSYRYQWIDYWAGEFNALNPHIDKKKAHVLVFGDSFSAFPKGYVHHLRQNYPTYNVINCAIPGTGPLEMSYMAKRRIRNYPPKVIIYQLYVGNDLTDIYPNRNWSELSIARNLYYRIGEDFRVLGNLSRKLKQANIVQQKDFNENVLSQKKIEFDARLYSPRSKMLFKANPNYLNESINLNSPRMQAAFKRALNCITYLKKIAPKKCPIYIVLIPHAAQVKKDQAKNIEKVGAKPIKSNAEYPLLSNLRKELKAQDIYVLSPLEYFQSLDFDPYFSNDPHLTPKGHQALYSFLLENIPLLFQEKV